MPVTDLQACQRSSEPQILRPPGHLLGVLWFSSSIGLSAAYAVCKHSVHCVWGCFVVAFLWLCYFVRCGEAAWPGLFSTADHDVSVPRRSAFEQDVEHGNTDGLGDCQSKQAHFTPIFPPLFHTPHTSPLFSVNSGNPPFPSSLLSPLSPPSVQSSQIFLSASSIHLSLSALVLLCPRPSVSLVPWLMECCVPLSKDWVPSWKLQWKHNRNIHRKGFYLWTFKGLIL